jgi:hypothetical protein
VGVGEGVVCTWRKALGVTRTNNERTNKLIRAASEVGAATQRGKRLSPEQVERRRQTNLALNLGRNLILGYHGPRWTKAQLCLLGTEPDYVVAAKIGRTTNGVRIMRTQLGIPNAYDRRRRTGEGGGREKGTGTLVMQG